MCQCARASLVQVGALRGEWGARGRRLLRVTKWGLRVLVGLGVGVALSQALLPDRGLLQTWIAAATPWGYLPAVPLLAWTVWRRRWPEAAGLAVVVLLWVGWLLPQVVGGAVEGPPDFRVASINALAWNARPDSMIRDVAATEADVLAIQEVSPELAAAIETEAFDRWPHRLVLPREDAFGIAVLSRFPMRAHVEDLGPTLPPEAREGPAVAEPYVVADLDIGGRPLRLLAVHTLPPFGARYAAIWRRQCAVLVERVEGERTPLIVAGDLNATPFHRVLRDLDAAGLRDGHGAVGRGLTTTFPTDRWLPPMLLDHVLASEELAFTAVSERTIGGSDHRAVVAGLRWAGE